MYVPPMDASESSGLPQHVRLLHGTDSAHNLITITRNTAHHSKLGIKPPQVFYNIDKLRRSRGSITTFLARSKCVVVAGIKVGHTGLDLVSTRLLT